ncbi:EF-hand domain-containing protein [Thalassococcus sp. CAU 1522]|uniref:EF-hand domain-containing protein n=1 Tax=Thalassococcus arenae TaxID=2851652 RepID=A0ABS6N5P9_9RHOB|nr:EF-hand domain-containing protein [Thalassococcus arenae]MBV2358860.1 EF-hand domain-containing protein [Thalassococcus arenae]
MRILFLPFVLAASTALAQQQVPGAHFMENWDADADGQVTLAELQDKREQVFYMFDSDEDGMLDAEEYRMFDETRALDMQNNAANAGRGPMRRLSDGLQLAANDTDGDGQVSRDEFLTRSADWLARIDIDGDGVVTLADFRPGPGKGPAKAKP